MQQAQACPTNAPLLHLALGGSSSFATGIAVANYYKTQETDAKLIYQKLNAAKKNT